MARNVPRFQNPHLLPEAAENVSRKQLLLREEEPFEPDEQLVSRLHALVQESVVLPSLKRPSIDPNESVPKKKRRKKETKDEEPLEATGTTPFRLISTKLPPQAISLKAKPIPKSKYREPECEDSPAQAEERRTRAANVAIDGSHILDITTKTQARQRHQKLSEYKATIPKNQAELFLIQCPTHVRTTRPPVPKTELQVYPYMKQAKISQVESQCKACPVVDAIPISQPCKGPRKRKRKGNSAHKHRPPAQFWRPKPSWEGKCQGYAMGYPGSSSKCAVGYIRDTMRKGVHASTLWNQ